MKKTRKQQIQEEIINIVDSQYMKNFLLKIQDDIKIHEYMDLICAAPISLKKKAGLLELLSGLSTNKGEYKQVHACYRTVMTALDRLYHMDGKKSCLVMTCIDAQDADYLGSQIIETIPVYSYSDALRHIRKKFLECMDEKESIGLDLVADFYFELELYELDEHKTFIPQYDYICTSSGRVQYFRNHLAYRRKKGSDYEQWFEGWGMEHWSTPYQSGDILYVDCRPYHPPVYCLIYYTTPPYENDCCAIRCLYLTYGGMIEEGAFKHGRFSPKGNILFCSPIFRAELYQGELPEQYAFMKPVSEALKKDLDLGFKLHSIFDYSSEAKEYTLQYVPLDKQQCRDRTSSGMFCSLMRGLVYRETTIEKMMDTIEGLSNCKSIQR